MRAPLRSLFAAAVLSFSTDALAQQAQGFGELRVAAFPWADGERFQLVERLRPTFQAELADRVKLVATIEAALAQGRTPARELERALRQGGLGALVDNGTCCEPEYANDRLRLNRSADYLDVDRLHLDFYAGGADFRLGRQPLNWGSAQFFNPTDPFPEVLFAEPWRPRRGVNALRATVPLGGLHDLSAVVATNDTLNELRAAARARVNWKGTDFALVGAWRGEGRNALVGVDLRGTLGVGWWVEAAWFFGASAHEEVAVGIDYSFPILERAVVFAQYYRNGAGSKDPLAGGALPGLDRLGVGCTPAAGQACTVAERDPFAPFTRGRDYALVGTTLGVLPELSASLFALQNLNDGSGFAVPTVTWSVLDWLDASLSAQVAYALWGGGGELKPRAEDLRFEQNTLSGPVSVDLSGLVPTATVTLWTRASF